MNSREAKRNLRLPSLSGTTSEAAHHRHTFELVIYIEDSTEE